MIVEQPYFLSNPEWYEYDYELSRYILTDIAPAEAIESYKEFYDLLDEDLFFISNG